MRVFFLKNWDRYKPGENTFIERTLALRLIERGVLRPYDHTEIIAEKIKRREKKIEKAVKVKK